MKKTLLAVMMAGSVMAMVNAAHAADGTVKFVGNIIDQACTVDTSSANQTVQLGDVAASSFGNASGVQSSGQKFNIVLTACPAGTVAVGFAGTADPADSTLLRLDAGQTATGVGVRINNNDGTQVLMNDTASPARVTVPAGGGDVTLSYVGQYQSTSASVTAGTANATSQFTVLYN
ncbi:type 1 fimbrial protein [Enterobacter asburiae]|uniref:fimbrial protein n=1 Tax=Enterobacter asburiae TaxID=61645 RepID=UPI00192C0161|nr:fimbrial protein [Enterobacter asburiae]MBL5945896.1 type 1 fimbrial protein [Enterobacter asburiae]